MNLKDLSSHVSKYAPLLASVIGEANPIAGLVIMALAKAFNCSSNPDDIIASMSADPGATQLKLQQLQIEHEDALNQNQIEDDSNARAREEDIIKLTGRRDWVLDFIAVLVVVGFFVLCAINYFIKLNDDHVVIMLIGQISSGFMLCLSYYFGSSNNGK